MRPITVTVGPLVTASANNICLSQTPTGALTLNGSLVSNGVAVLDTPRRILVTTGGSDSTKTITFVGTDWNGSPITEKLALVNSGTSYTNLDFATITSATISATAAAALTVGTNGVASSMWVRLDEYASPQVGVQATVSGTVNYTLQQTMQDPNSPTNPVSPSLVTWVNTSDTNGVTATASVQSFYAYAPTFTKVTLNSGTGSVTVTYNQYSNAPY
jgi:hypothetical protein